MPGEGGLPATAFALVLLILIVTGTTADIQGQAALPILGIITRDLGLTAGEATMLTSAFQISGLVAIFPVSVLGDKYGHRHIFIGLSILALVGSLVCAFATNGPLIIAGRFTQGFATVQTIVWGIVRAGASTRQVDIAGRLQGGLFVIFAACSLVIGGLLIRLGLGWQGIFYVMAIGYAVMAVAALGVADTPPGRLSSRPIDWVGCIGIGSWFAVLLGGVSFIPRFGASSVPVLGCVGASVVLFLLWAVQQRRAIYPLMDWDGVNVARVMAGYLAMAGIVCSGCVLFVVLPFALSSDPSTGYGHGYEPLEASLPLLALVPGAIIAGTLYPRAVRSLGHRFVIIASGLLITFVVAMLAYVHADLAAIYMLMFAWGCGSGIAYAAGWSMLPGAARPDNTAFVVAAVICMFKASTTIVLALVVVALNPQFTPPQSVLRDVILATALLPLTSMIAAVIFLNASRQGG